MANQGINAEVKKTWIAVRLAARAVSEVGEDYGLLTMEEARRMAAGEVRARLEQFGVSAGNQAALVNKVLKLASMSIRGMGEE